MDERLPQGGSGDAPGRPDETVAGVRLTGPDRPLYGRQGLTKGDLARYFERASRWILAHVADRPLAILRCRKNGACFLQRYATTDLPPVVRRAQVPRGTRTRAGFCVDSVQGLVALAQVGALEVHAWNARVSELGTPDRMIFDLDPSTGVPWDDTVDGARDLRAVLEARGLRSFAKLTGGRGIHVVVPLSPEHGWAEVLRFSRTIAEEWARRRPDRRSVGPSGGKRKGGVVIDPHCNAQGAAVVGAYSPRARRGAPVSMPVSWSELSADLASDAFPVERALERIEKLREDPWTGFHRLIQTLPRDNGPVPRGGGESQA